MSLCRCNNIPMGMISVIWRERKKYVHTRRLKASTKTMNYACPENDSECGSKISMCAIPTVTSNAPSIRPKYSLCLLNVVHGGHRIGPLTCAILDGMSPVISMVLDMDLEQCFQVDGATIVLHNLREIGMCSVASLRLWFCVTGLSMGLKRSCMRHRSIQPS